MKNKKPAHKKQRQPNKRNGARSAIVCKLSAGEPGRFALGLWPHRSTHSVRYGKFLQKVTKTLLALLVLNSALILTIEFADLKSIFASVVNFSMTIGPAPAGLQDPSKRNEAGGSSNGTPRPTVQPGPAVSSSPAVSSDPSGQVNVPNNTGIAVGSTPGASENTGANRAQDDTGAQNNQSSQQGGNGALGQAGQAPNARNEADGTIVVTENSGQIIAENLEGNANESSLSTSGAAMPESSGVLNFFGRNESTATNFNENSFQNSAFQAGNQKAESSGGQRSSVSSNHNSVQTVTILDKNASPNDKITAQLAEKPDIQIGGYAKADLLVQEVRLQAERTLPWLELFLIIALLMCSFLLYMRKVLCAILFVLVANIFLLSGEVKAIGISPGQIILDNVLTNSTTKIHVTASRANASQNQYISLTTGGQLSEFLKPVNAGDVLFSQNEQEITLPLELKLGNVAIGTYTGTITVTQVAQQNQNQNGGQGSTILSGARAKITITVSRNPIESYEITNVSPAPQGGGGGGSPIVSFSISNKGNVDVKPSLIKMVIINKKDPHERYEELITPNQIDATPSFNYLTQNLKTKKKLKAGSYLADVFFYDKNQKLIKEEHNLPFEVPPEPLPIPKGQILYFQIKKDGNAKVYKLNETIKFLAKFKNTGKIDTNATLNIEILKDRKQTGILKTKPMLVKKNRTASFSQPFKILQAGEYTAKGTITYGNKKTQLLRINFSVKPFNFKNFGKKILKKL